MKCNEFTIDLHNTLLTIEFPERTEHFERLAAELNAAGWAFQVIHDLRTRSSYIDCVGQNGVLLHRRILHQGEDLQLVAANAVHNAHIEWSCRNYPKGDRSMRSAPLANAASLDDAILAEYKWRSE